MSTENQIRALGNWLSGEVGKDEMICEMPFEICSDALTRLSQASQAYKEGKAERGSVGKAKKEIAHELRQHGWIGDPMQAPFEKEAKPQEEADIYIDENEYEELNDDDFEAEPEPEDATVEDPVSRYVELIAKITETVEEDQRIPLHEKGYAVNNVFQAISRDMRSELIAELAEKRGGVETPFSDF